ncbi:MAG TPA: GNAT family N-acetyltransferase [Kofleriaceae bacterium]|nr:GNAT family N-acetyltransferase [Kofleriaceae bacterium]
MSELELRGWRDGDAGAAAELARRYFAPDPPWRDGAEARAQLTADALGRGAHVRVAERGGRVVGVGGYVAAPPWLYLWPVMADDGEAAGALLEALVAAGAGGGERIERARVSVRAIEPGKEAAVVARGYQRSIEFVEVVRQADKMVRQADKVGVGTAAAAGLERRAGAAIDRRAMHATHERSFAEIANTAPMSEADFDRLLDGAAAWPEATAAWFAADGTCAGFVIGLRHPDHGVVEAIGVHPAFRRRGLAAAMLEHLLAAAAEAELPEVRAMIAGNNAGSLALHAAAGFVERARKQLWDLDLTAR